ECGAALRRDRLDDLPQDIVAGWIPGWDPRHSWIPPLLPPTDVPRRAFLQPVLLATPIIGGFNIVHVMMAGKTLELGKFRPGRRGTLLGAPSQPLQTLAQGHHLPHSPGPSAHTIAWSRAPVRRQHGGVGLEIKDQIRMASRDQLVIDISALISHMTRDALLSPFDQVTRVIHAYGS